MPPTGRSQATGETWHSSFQKEPLLRTKYRQNVEILEGFLQRAELPGRGTMGGMVGRDEFLSGGPSVTFPAAGCRSPPASANRHRRRRCRGETRETIRRPAPVSVSRSRKDKPHTPSAECKLLLQ